MNGPSRPDTGVGQPGNSDDRLLGGRLRLSQPKQGYRVAIDPILLAAAIDATAGERILDAGCGTGAAALCLAMRALECTITGVERDAELAALACSNVAINGLNGRIAVVECALEDYAGAFDQVMTNPPFHESDTHTRSPQLTKASAHGETALDLAGWVKATAKLLKPGGRLTLIHRADRLGDILQAFEGRFGAAAIFPFWPRDGVEAKRILVTAIKGRRTLPRLLPGLVLHQEDGAYTAQAEAILRDAAALDLGLGSS
jgi:tRNA1(Val) A37 N6-methylase TrmN6